MTGETRPIYEALDTEMKRVKTLQLPVCDLRLSLVSRYWLMFCSPT